MFKKVQTIYRMLLFVASVFTYTLVTGQDVASVKVKVNSSEDEQGKKMQPLQKVIQEIENKFQVFLNYPDELVNGKYVYFSGTGSSKSLDQALKEVLIPLELQYEHIGKNYYLITKNSVSSKINRIQNKSESEKEESNSGNRPSGANIQNMERLLHFLGRKERNVSGRVVSQEDNTPIPGVNVLVKNSTIGTVTDVEGHYTLTVPDNATTLVFSYVGFNTIEAQISGRSVIDVSLVADIEQLSEVVVVGYGTQERTRVTGAISSVTSKDISEQPVASFDQALQGRAAGITVANSGSPGVNPIVRIRGMGTVGDNNPLYVIDGMPAGGINEINPNDIESIQVLKDASASAIYGSRAANGVIIVTTKKGTQGKTNINLDTYYGVQNAWKQLDLLNRDQYMDFGRDLIDPAAPPQRFVNLGEYANVDTDWQDEMFRTASIQDYNVSVTGGGDNSKFNVAGGYFKQQGIMLGTGFERFSVRANSEFTLGKVKIGETLTLARTERQNEPYNGGRTQIEHMMKMIPYIPVRDPNRVGGYGGAESNAMDGSDPENPVLNAMLRRNIDENLKILGTGYASIEILKGLEYKLLLGIDMNLGYNDQFAPIINSPGQYHYNATADINQTRNDFISPLISNQLSFNKDFGSHHIDAVAVVEKQTSRFRSTGAIGETDMTSDIDVLGIASRPVISGTRNEYALISYLARVNYDFGGKYLFGASVRRDGGSRFGAEKWGTFPSVSAGWRISEEPFLNGVTFLSDLKVRASWGKVGNDAIGNYRYQPTIASGQFYVFGSGQAIVPGFTTRALANEDIKWETTVMTNIGVDLGFLNDKIRASVEYFNNETQDMLLEVPVAPSLGYDVAPTANVGTVVNKGFELTAGYYQSQGNLRWTLSGNISFINNELTSLGSGNSISGSDFLTTGVQTTFTEEGQPIAYFRGWVVDGIFQSQSEIDAAPFQTTDTSPGDIRFKDLTGPEGVPDGVVNDLDRTNIGHFLPDFSYGISGTLNFMNFDLSVFLQGVSGNEIVNTNRYHTEGMTRLFNATTVVLDRWTPQNTDTNVPRAITGDPNRNARLSTRFVEDGSYFRIKNLSVGYSLPESVLSGFGNGFVKNLRIYLSSQNLLTVTDYSGYDPEIGVRNDLASQGGRSQTLNSGVDFGQYPQPRTFIGGIQIRF